jgi:hypothetical protein
MSDLVSAADKPGFVKVGDEVGVSWENELIFGVVRDIHPHQTKLQMVYVVEGFFSRCMTPPTKQCFDFSADQVFLLD